MKSVRFLFWSLVAPGTVFLLLFLILLLISIVVFSFWRTESDQLYPDWNLDNTACCSPTPPMPPS